MDINGIDVGNLAIELPFEIPATVPGRVLQVDGDQLCYQTGCFDDEPFSTAKSNFESVLQSWILMAGADRAVIHLTGDNKGGRYEIATLKEYQANRKGKVAPKHLAALRAYVQDNYGNCEYHYDQEADDGMAQANYAAIIYGNRDLSVICSADKDLRMCSGLHLNTKTGEIIDVDGYGYVELLEGKPKKLVGYGTAFFWAQLLMGDTADNIPGLPACGPATLVRYEEFRTKAIEKLLDQCACGNQGKEDAAAEKIDALKHKACGQVAAYHIIKHCTNDNEALGAVLQAYRDHYGQGQFNYTAWDGTVKRATAGTMMVEQANLLWMRRYDGDRFMDFAAHVKDGRQWDGKATGA